MQQKIAVPKLLLLVLILCFSSLLYSQKTGKSSVVNDGAVSKETVRGILKGVVKDDSGVILPGALITIEGTLWSTKSNGDGYYRITDIKAGNYNIKCVFTGFKSMEKRDVKIEDGKTTNLDFKLVSDIMLKSVDKLPPEKKQPEKAKGEAATGGSSAVKKESSGDLHFSGGRSSETSYVIDGTSTKAPEIKAPVKKAEDTPPPVTTTKKFDSEIPPPPPPASKVEKEESDAYEVGTPEPIGRFKDESIVSKKVAARSAAGLKAGFSDDNKQFNYFLDFLHKYRNAAPHIVIPVEERIVLKIRDVNDKPVCDAEIKIFDQDMLLSSGLSHADGQFLFFPSQFPANNPNYRAEISYQQKKYTLKFSRQDKRVQELKLPVARINYQQVPLDVLFIFDTTGSMGEEIDRLKKTIELINLNLAELPSRPLVRFGMVLYRDKRDAYVTKIVPFTDSLALFMKELAKVQADGGGDLAEDLNSALEAATNKVKWNPDGVKMAFVITDAPAHLDYDQPFAYDQQVVKAVEKGIKIFTVGTGGLDIKGEYMLRQISQYTSGKYIFLTYGEKGESEGGVTGGVSHHTGDNFQTDKLEAVIIKFAKEELEYFKNDNSQIAEDYFKAVSSSDQSDQATIDELFGKAIGQLIDFSAILLPAKMNTAILPLQTVGTDDKIAPEYLTERLNQALLANKQFKLIERGNLKSIVEELSLQQTGLTSESNLTKAGQLLGADYLLTGKLFYKNGVYELYLRLVRVESGEILAVTKAEIDQKLVTND